jgi:hypothetical protein
MPFLDIFAIVVFVVLGATAAAIVVTLGISRRLARPAAHEGGARS